MKSVFIFGITGRMGQEVSRLIENSKNFKLLGGYSRSNKNISQLKSPDIVIDFSLPEAFPDLEVFMNKHRCKLVSGTTGLSSEQKQQLIRWGQNNSVFWTANMSFGVYLMCQLTQTLAQYEKLYGFKIEETHHVHKKDKPSGTALLIQEAANRSTKMTEPIVSHRKGEVFGEHKFSALSENEVLEIRHEAFNRGLFAQGSIDIASWLISKPSGYYQMDDFSKSLLPN